MKLIGMLDSPYVRRTAISLSYLGVPFEHQAISVFSNFAQFQTINPVVKAPSLVFDDGEVLMDSTLILQYAEAIAADSRRLIPEAVDQRRRVLRSTGLALAACEKAVQIVYECNLRPPQAQHQPWLDRITGQLLAACAALEIDIAKHNWVLARGNISQAEITAAVVWQFIESMLPDLVIAKQFPALRSLSAAAEQLSEFIAFPPLGPGV